MTQLVREAGGEIAGIFYCPHTPAVGCPCRKPGIGLFEAIARRFAVDLKGQPAIGDSLRDLLAAQRAGCRPLLVRTGNGRRTEVELARTPDRNLAAVPVYEDLAAAAEALIGARP